MHFTIIINEAMDIEDAMVDSPLANTRFTGGEGTSHPLYRLILLEIVLQISCMREANRKNKMNR